MRSSTGNRRAHEIEDRPPGWPIPCAACARADGARNARDGAGRTAKPATKVRRSIPDDMASLHDRRPCNKTIDCVTVRAAGLFILIELPRGSCHFQAADKIRIARHSTRFRSDAVGLFRRRKRRPFANELLPHRLLALDALREGEVGVALFRGRPPVGRSLGTRDRRSDREPLAIAPAKSRSRAKPPLHGITSTSPVVVSVTTNRVKASEPCSESG
jgi:hypothetical protein